VRHANDIYTFAGSSSGTNATPATVGRDSGLLNGPSNVVVGNGQQVYIARPNNNRIQEVASSSHTEFGISMTTGDIYTIAGAHRGLRGIRQRGLATSALLSGPARSHSTARSTSISPTRETTGTRGICLDGGHLCLRWQRRDHGEHWR